MGVQGDERGSLLFPSLPLPSLTCRTKTCDRNETGCGVGGGGATYLLMVVVATYLLLQLSKTCATNR